MATTAVKNRRLLALLLLLAVGMFGFGFALVPLYNVFCDLTGLGGKGSDATVAGEEIADLRPDYSRRIGIEFVAMVSDRAPFLFKPLQKKIHLSPGELKTVRFLARNLSPQPRTVRFVPSYDPGYAKDYFKKVACFCFTQLPFRPGEEKLLEVRFVVDPALPEKVTDITLFYMLYDTTKAP